MKSNAHGPETTAPSSTPPGRHSLIRAKLLNLIEACVFLTLVVQGLSLLGRYHFLPDLATHFRFQAMTVLLIGAVILLIGRRRTRIRWVGLVVGGLLASSFVPYLRPSFARQPAAGSYRLAVMNVLTGNPQRQDVLAYFQQLNVDFLILLEVDDAWEQTLRGALHEELPYSMGHPRQDNFGILLLSKHRWLDAEVRSFGLDENAVPSIDAEFEIDGQHIRIVGTHPMPPMSSFHWRARNAQFAEVADAIRVDGSASHTLLAGDLNCTPWSPFFRQLLVQSGLRDSALGYGLWPTWYVLPTWLGGLPIDHVLVGNQVLIERRFVGPDLGSDHRAVVVDFRCEKI